MNNGQLLDWHIYITLWQGFLVQVVAEVAKQQLADVSEAAVKEKEAAVSKSIQSVQRRASKEALQQVLLYLMYTFAEHLLLLLLPLYGACACSHLWHL